MQPEITNTMPAGMHGRWNVVFGRELKRDIDIGYQRLRDKFVWDGNIAYKIETND